MMSLSLPLVLILILIVSIGEANYEFTIRFYEFRNPLGLQCGECGSGGQPACCDDVNRTENCNNLAPFNCDTRFQFLLRPFGAPVKTARSGGFPYFTPSNGGNSHTFNIGPGGLLALPNPFIITSTSEWTGRIQFFIDAIDRAVSRSGLTEVEVIINRFLVDLKIEVGADFTERTTYTGVYNITGVEFDMSFRVQCSENYYGPNCTTFCEPIEGVYACDSEGNIICTDNNRDVAANCTTCLPGYDPSTNCTTQTTTTTATLLSDMTSQTPQNSNTCDSCSITPAILGGVLGLSVAINIILIIVVVVVVTKVRVRVTSLSLTLPHTSVNEGGTLDIEMKPNSLYGQLTAAGSDNIVTKPNEVYGVSHSVPAEPSQPEAYEYVNP